jgi:cytidylate kinase
MNYEIFKGRDLGQDVLTPEQLRLREEVLGGEIAGLIIGGPPGTGKTVLAEFLIDAFGIRKEDLFLAGQERRLQAGVGDEASGMMTRTPEQDAELDAEQLQRMENVKPEDISKGRVILIESHLGPILRNIAREANPNLPPMITIEPTAPKKVRMRWIRDRSIRKQTEEIAKLEEKLGKLLHRDSPDAPLAEPEIIEHLYDKLKAEKAKHFTLASVTKHENDRDAGDTARFQEIYPWAIGIKNLYDPDLVDEHGQKIYDIVIPVADLKLEEVPGVALERIIGYRRALEAEANRPVLIEDDFPRPGDSRLIQGALRNQLS